MPDGQFKSVFDIIGPIMVGPSSSHTAGAARIGKVVRQIFGQQPDSVDIWLYESFAKTYRGHGTDIAIVAGLLGMEPDDSRLASSLKMAHEQHMEVCFVPKKEAAEHPNQVKLIVKKGDETLTVTGISIGGGNILISELNGFKIHLTTGAATILIVHQDVPGMIAEVTSVLQDLAINIATMTVSRAAKGQQAIMVLEIDTYDIGEGLTKIKEIPNIHNASFFK